MCIQLVEEGRKSIFYVVKTNYDGGTGGVSMHSSEFLYLNGENLFGENVRRGKLRHLAKIFVTFPRRKIYLAICVLMGRKHIHIVCQISSHSKFF